MNDTTEERVVLLVDDMPSSLDFLVQALDAAGYTVLVAAGGAAAIRLLSLAVPDAILLDAVMPDMDGFETCRRIKQEPAYAHVPVIFMTGLSETEHIVAGFDAGGVDYVVKPLKLPEVMARLTTHTRNARLARLAREALDIGGHGVLLLDGQGRIAWQSPLAAHWLASAQAGDLERIGALILPGVDPAGIHLAMAGGLQLQIRPLGQSGSGEYMLLLTRTQGEASTTASAAHHPNFFSLTSRETEVLSWIAKGKTNRDIADILGMSPRTVSKHLEHVFEKLGVETRSAAAALAAREFGSVR